MSTPRKILLALLVVALVVLIIVFWGSIASIIFISGLIMIVPVYFFNRFVNNDEGSDFTDNENS